MWNMFKVNSKDQNDAKLWTYFTTCSGVSIVKFKHVIASWESCSKLEWYWCFTYPLSNNNAQPKNNSAVRYH